LRSGTALWPSPRLAANPRGPVRSNDNEDLADYIFAEIVNVTEKATFAAGCFWGVEETYRKVKGVISTTVGYTGGSTKNPTYEDVCTDRTGHAEAIQVEYDPLVVSYEDLLRVFWESHDPTTPNRQGPDFGSQYRSAIFYHNDQQKTSATASRDRLQSTGRFTKKRIVTEIVAAKEFYPAEDYHQQYLQKRGLVHCRVC
jgi:peptide-methionine (S)-S-oxide reductase